MIFGVTSQLGKAFEKMGISSQQPTWFIGPQPFAVGDFSSSMKSFETALSSTLASTPSSSGSGGGGSAGGGFGGGGGGSW